MPPLPINLQEKKQADSPEARSARARRYSTDNARRNYYRAYRTIRFSQRLTRGI